MRETIERIEEAAKAKITEVMMAWLQTAIDKGTSKVDAARELWKMRDRGEHSKGGFDATGLEAVDLIRATGKLVTPDDRRLLHQYIDEPLYLPSAREAARDTHDRTGTAYRSLLTAAVVIVKARKKTDAKDRHR